MGKFPKDPRAPKRSPSAYFLFAADARPALQKKFGSDICAISKQMGKMYKALSDSDRAKYQKVADKKKAVYQKKRAAYIQTSGYKKWCAAKKEHDKKHNQQKKLKKLMKNKPKRGMSAYMFFANEQRPKIIKANPSWQGPGGFANVAGEISQRWANMSDAQKKPYEKKSQKSHEQARKKLQTYKKSAEYAKYVQAVKDFKKQQREEAKMNKVVNKKQK